MDERTLARLDGGRSVIDPDSLIPIMATRAAADHLGGWTIQQAQTAVHESGHLLGANLCGALAQEHHGISALPRVQVDAVSIKGKHGGHTEIADDDTTSAFRQAPAVYSEIVVALCGQAAEEVVFGVGRASDGSSSDWRTATQAVMSLLDCGLIDGAPLASPLAFDYNNHVPAFITNFRGRVIEAELAWARAEARRLMHPERERLLAASRILFRERRLDPAGVDALLRDIGIEPARRAA